MKKLLSIVCACLSLYQVSKADTSFYSTPITEETPAELVREIIEEKEMRRRDLLNIISRFDEEKDRRRERYRSESLIGGYLLALQDEINYDPLFYAWEEYKENDFIIKNQALSALWDTLVAKYEPFRMIEDATIKLKQATTLETPPRFSYRIKLNPELDSRNSPRLKIRLKSKRRNFLEDLQVRVGTKKIEIGKEYCLESYGKKASFDLGFTYDYHDEYCIRATLKFPFWFD